MLRQVRPLHKLALSEQWRSGALSSQSSSQETRLSEKRLLSFASLPAGLECSPIGNLRRVIEKVLSRGFTRRLPLNYITLICGFAGHVFQLQLTELLQLADLLGGDLTSQVYRVVP